ncbi:MAG: SsrA-binding protein SmpB [Anaerolineae bacterium]
MSTTGTKRADRVLAENRKARHDYFIEETYEAGIALLGTEIKSMRAGRANLRDSYAQIKDGEMWLMNVHISPYDMAGYASHDPLRPRKLLLHRKEINRLAGAITEKGYTLVPLRIYLKDNRAKVELALARGKKTYDKRDAIAERDSKREIERALRDRDR